MDRIFIKDHQVFYLEKNFIGKSNKSEWITTYDKPIQLERKMECCVTDIFLPKNMFDYKIKEKNLIIEYNFIMMILKLPFFHNADENIKKRLNLDKARNFPYQVEKKIIKLNENYGKFEDVLDHITEIVNKDMNKLAKDSFNDYFHHSFDSNFNPTEDIEFKELSINFIYEENYSEKSIFYQAKPGSIILNDKSSKPGNLKHNIVAKFFFSFDIELHGFLGISPSMYPLNKLNRSSKLDFNEDKTKLRRYKNLFDNMLLYIHCDILKDSYVNNKREHILRSVNYKYSHQKYPIENKLFIPVRTDEFSSMKITIKDNEGDIFFFEDGYISITLLMRPIELS